MVRGVEFDPIDLKYKPFKVRLWKDVIIGVWLNGEILIWSYANVFILIHHKYQLHHGI